MQRGREGREEQATLLRPARAAAGYGPIAATAHDGRCALHLGPTLVAVLRRHRAAQNEQRLLLGGGWKDWGLVFPSGLGTPLQENTIRRVFARICRTAEVPLIRLHDLRHTCATLMLLGGTNVKVVSERLGHASVVITMQTYAHVLPGMQEDAATALEMMLRPPRQQGASAGH